MAFKPNDRESTEAASGSTADSPWSRPAVSFGPLLASFAVHLMLVVGVFVWAQSRPSAGTTVAPETNVGVVMAYRSPKAARTITRESVPESNAATESPNDRQIDERSTASPSETSAPTNPSSIRDQSSVDQRPSAASAPPAGFVPPVDLAGLYAEMTRRGSKAGQDDGRGKAARGIANATGIEGVLNFGEGRTADDLGDDELIPGESRAGQGAGQTTTSVFGVSGSGSTFVYVFDHSESMSASGGKPLRAAKEELIRSLCSLSERQQFQIIFYNDRPKAFSPDGQRIGLVFGEDGTRKQAEAFVDRTVAIGGTEHLLALRMALRLAPDVIFFLTDASIQTMSADEMADVRRRAEETGTVIHAIQFGTGAEPANSFMKEIARQNGGGYRYLDVVSGR
ncbi:hypothetical protein LOC71_13875 [Rhodopirellula sp. JC740]|uniref:VWFA domain-containing protein n=1 Tax=Rhodopirellula halodulae TaxID=2894198 RepID=A0ABS8NIJ3_9BACT|nr:hypothetical protein [Rhodopirellula sp. JC740]MCC9643369.1 hypothetical protein [Rhodopirellula sp. JC740]